jgi:acyl carrier protein
MEIRETIRNYVLEILVEEGYGEDVLKDDSLVTSGVFSSLTVVDIASFMEKTYGLDFSKIYFDSKDFESIDNMVTLIEKNQ